ncbi:MAG: phosphohistidine phosphatase SixA [bacterium]|jgi:phosphohistidine phosphatase
MDLFIIRHGIAVDRKDPNVKSDEERWLTEKGTERMQKIASGFARMTPALDEILTSPYVRAAQTAEILSNAYPTKVPVKSIDGLKPGFRGNKMLSWLRDNYSATARIALVGHEPDLSKFVILLTTRAGNLNLKFKKGGICRIDFSRKPRAAEGTLVYLLPPKVFCQ